MILNNFIELNISHLISTIGYQKKFEDIINIYNGKIDEKNNTIETNNEKIFFTKDEIKFENENYYIRYNIILNEFSVKYKKDFIANDRMYLSDFSISLKNLKKFYENYIEAKNINKLKDETFINNQILFFSKSEFVENKIFSKNAIISKNYFELLKKFYNIKTDNLMLDVMNNHEYIYENYHKKLKIKTTEENKNINIILKDDEKTLSIENSEINLHVLCPFGIDFLSEEKGLFEKISNPIKNLYSLSNIIKEIMEIQKINFKENNLKIKKVTQTEFELLTLISDYNFPNIKKILDKKISINQKIKEKEKNEFR